MLKCKTFTSNFADRLDGEISNFLQSLDGFTIEKIITITNRTMNNSNCITTQIWYKSD